MSRWFALKVFHNKVSLLECKLASVDGAECYVPREHIVVESTDGKRLQKERQAITGLMFLKINPARLPLIKKEIGNAAMFYPAADGTPAIISEKEMAMFRLVASAGTGGLEYLAESTACYAVGQKVRVIDGPFAGAEGNICRIRGNRRLVVSIHGICAIATSYIPACFLKKID